MKTTEITKKNSNIIINRQLTILEQDLIRGKHLFLFLKVSRSSLRYRLENNDQPSPEPFNDVKNSERRKICCKTSDILF